MEDIKIDNKYLPLKTEAMIILDRALSDLTNGEIKDLFVSTNNFITKVYSENYMVEYGRHKDYAIVHIWRVVSEYAIV